MVKSAISEPRCRPPERALANDHPGQDTREKVLRTTGHLPQPRFDTPHFPVSTTLFPSSKRADWWVICSRPWRGESGKESGGKLHPQRLPPPSLKHRAHTLPAVDGYRSAPVRSPLSSWQSACGPLGRTQEVQVKTSFPRASPPVLQKRLLPGRSANQPRPAAFVARRASTCC
jgi:hypothetical protein